MIAAVAAALTACLVFAAAGPRLARLLPPAVAVRLLVPAGLAAASCAVFVLGTVTFTWLGQLAQIARYGNWSPQRLHALSPIPAPAAVAAGVLLVPVSCWSLLIVVRRVRALLAIHRACRDLAGAAGSGLVVVDSDDIDAFTTPGLAGRIVITAGMLDVLDADGRRAVLAHEQSHNHHRHLWWILAADLAAAVNPLLRPTATAIGEATERWADEDAAAATGRRLVARTIAQVALLRAAAARRPASGTAATGGQVPRRVQALLEPAPRTRARHLGLALVLSAAILITGFAVERSGEALFEHAEEPSRAAAAAGCAIRQPVEGLQGWGCNRYLGTGLPSRHE